MWNGVKRRGTDMNEGFEPKTGFEVYVKVTLDNIEKKFDDLPCGESFARLNKVENKVSNIEGKTTIIGVVSGFIAGVLAKIFVK